jgi:hypothetical protein
MAKVKKAKAAPAAKVGDQCNFCTKGKLTEDRDGVLRCARCDRSPYDAPPEQPPISDPQPAVTPRKAHRP